MTDQTEIVKEMRGAAEPCTTADIGLEITGDGAEPILAAIDEYLSAFAKPIVRDDGGGFLLGKYQCLQCGEPLDGALGTFQWGMVNGEGTCDRCGWPARAHHYPKDADGAIFDRPLVFILQYRPASITHEVLAGGLGESNLGEQNHGS